MLCDLCNVHVQCIECTFKRNKNVLGGKPLSLSLMRALYVCAGLMSVIQKTHRISGSLHFIFLWSCILLCPGIQHFSCPHRSMCAMRFQTAQTFVKMVWVLKCAAVFFLHQSLLRRMAKLRWWNKRIDIKWATQSPKTKKLLIGTVAENGPPQATSFFLSSYIWTRMCWMKWNVQFKWNK